MTESNDTTTVPEWVSYLLPYWAHMTLGALNAVGNGLIVLPILYHRAFRNKNEYVMLAGLAFADSMNGLAYVLNGVYIHWLLLVSVSATDTSFGFTKFVCGCLPWNAIWAYMYTQSGTMLVMINLDRLLVTKATLWLVCVKFLVPFVEEEVPTDADMYVATGVRLAHLMLGASYAHGIVFGIVQAISGFFRWNSLAMENACYPELSMEPVLYEYMVLVYTYSHVASIALAALTLATICARNRQSEFDYDGRLSGPMTAPVSRGVQLKTERKMTVKTLWSSLATLLLVVLPVQIEVLLRGKLSLEAVLAVYTLTLVNPLINVYIFLVNHSLLRQGLKKVLRREQGPPQYRDWIKPKSITSVKEAPKGTQ